MWLYHFTFPSSALCENSSTWAQGFVFSNSNSSVVVSHFDFNLNFLNTSYSFLISKTCLETWCFKPWGILICGLCLIQRLGKIFPCPVLARTCTSYLQSVEDRRGQKISFPVFGLSGASVDSIRMHYCIYGFSQIPLPLNLFSCHLVRLDSPD